MPTQHSEQLYFEDLKPGGVFKGGPATLSQEYLINFASEYDPQPFHTDPELAKDSFFGQLVASGWHTSAITMKLWAQSDMKIAGGLVGIAIDRLRWPKPVYPDDTIAIEITIRDESRLLRSKPGKGIVKADVITLNQNDETVMSMIVTLVVPVSRTSSGDKG